MTAHKVIHECGRAGLTLRVVGDQIGATPSRKLTQALVEKIRAHKFEITEALLDLHEAREERAAILEFDHDMDRHAAEQEAWRRVRFVTCDSSVNWEGKSPCKAGFHTSGDPSPVMATRICSGHVSRRRRE